MASPATKRAVASVLLVAAALMAAYVFFGRKTETYRPAELGTAHYVRKAMQSNDIRTQCEAMQVLAKTRPPEGETVCVAKLKSPDDVVVAVAAHALGEYKSKAAVQPLVDELKRPSNMARFSVVKALGQIGDPSALTGLKAQVADQTTTAADAAWAIGELRDPATRKIPADAEDALIGYLSSPLPRIRVGALLGLRDGGTERSLAALKKLAANPFDGIDPNVLAAPLDEGRKPTPDLLGKPCQEAIHAIQKRIGTGGTGP